MLCMLCNCWTPRQCLCGLNMDETTTHVCIAHLHRIGGLMFIDGHNLLRHRVYGFGLWQLPISRPWTTSYSDLGRLSILQFLKDAERKLNSIKQQTHKHTQRSRMVRIHMLSDEAKRQPPFANVSNVIFLLHLENCSTILQSIYLCDVVESRAAYIFHSAWQIQ